MRPPFAFKRPVPWLLCPALLLSACAAPPALVSQPYVPYVGEQSARLVVRPEFPDHTVYRASVFEDAVSCERPRTVSQGSSRGLPRPAGVLIPAERLLTFRTLVVDDRVKRSCTNTVSIVPRTGRTYMLEAASDGDRCVAIVSDLTDVEKRVPTQMYVRNVQPDGRCNPIGEARMVPSLPSDNAKAGEGQ